MSAKSKVCAVLFFSMILISMLPIYADEDLSIEGIAYESKDPSQSLVSIHGNLYKQGERVSDYEIVEIRADRILVKNKQNQISEERITGGNSPAPAAAKIQTAGIPAVIKKNSTEEVSPEAAKQLPMLEQLQQFWAKFDIAAIMNYATQTMVLVDLRKLYTQANIATMESDNGKTPTMDAMIERGIVDRAFKENPNGYQFRVTSGSKGPMVFADPLRAADKSRHFMIDDEGRMRSEVGRPATVSSPLHQASFDVQKLVPHVPEQAAS